MKLYILRPVKDDPHWEPWYDKAFGFVVCAESARQARQLASEEAGDEVDKQYNNDYSELISVSNPWLSAKHSTCKELKPGKKQAIIMKDFHAA